MTRHPGQTSLFLVLGAWVAYYALLVVGGIDPSPALSRILQTAMLVLLAAVLLSFGLALYSLAQGRQRVRAAFALILCLLYGLVFSGALFAMFPSL